MIRFRVGVYRKDGITGVGIERLNDDGEVTFIGSYNCGNWSRRDVCVFYVFKIREMLNDGEIARIKVADRSVGGRKSWYRHYTNIEIYAASGSSCKGARGLAQDAWKRGEHTDIEENLL
ncbi:hypothetical protein [Bacillus sp. UMB0893]|uniref:hypothetical protein n=1 Tax=Bacillus sp. UMB0893 TaxID=2066053 RepID=UPI000C79294A|nr:hypothetical protein [Bacillus sp. UMB0893]PLR65981.1 hypothetical protein CYJ36_20110 [Bacillus sp. UMB0893]